MQQVRAVDMGPWDDVEVSAPRHMLDDRHARVGADLDVPHGSDVFEPANAPGLLLVQPPESVTTIGVSVLAWPGSAGWEDLCGRMACSLAADIRPVQDTGGAAEEAPAAVVDTFGPFGPELHVHAGDRRETVFLGASGYRWLVRATVKSVDVTAADLEAAYQILASMVVYRGGAAMPPGRSLSMACVVDLAHREQVLARESEDEIARRIWQQASCGKVA
ncbi:DUF3710 domain-containing protein [Corynebacterium bovis]|uniref:Uncharacterized protein n=1 Tax=Corynebacterium bovis DSM 20582 = CIP 54.80 TaxID=927655 RepID=A0A8H9YE51_9CORY|nr:DUF3710 domain-containing protein [Corynebacterium bovis]MBB3116949.1 hypothetical protein [Corynebacterium bovis DSM 20582 = CIP 54.80]MBB3116958.1 hypothetical protein [Corynebacterium bovis DSM 20582 = CIP 54.80]QQC48628.1 DUF3710 domain-containing protein [Corynebacterium bovis]WJY78639.1 hypothetical protein CBOVI_10785 [Corynebacterium bovis DSM 20582 = CIP 54.80]